MADVRMNDNLVDIPRLTGSGLPLGEPYELQRRFPVGKANYFRGFATCPMRLEVQLNEASRKSQVQLRYACIDGQGEQWRDLAFTAEEEGDFSCELHIERPGRYLLDVRYTVDGKRWMRDRNDYSYLLVDPEPCRLLKMYSFLPRLAGTIRDWEQDFERIRDMGFTMVHLLPVTVQDISNSPYAARDLFAIDRRYLNPDDQRSGLEQFDDLVDRMCELNLGLCVDLVLNHVGVTSVIARRRPEWIEVDPDEHDGLQRNGWWDGNTFHKWGDTVKLNYAHAHPPTRKTLWRYMKQYAYFWAEWANRTGGMIRLDNLHSSHYDFIRELLRDLRDRYPELIVQGEFFDAHQKTIQRVRDYGLNLLLATPWEVRFVPQLRQYMRFVHDQSQRVRYLFPVTSHDSGTPASEFGNVQATVPRYVLCALGGSGQTGMCMGVEYGVGEKLEFIGEPKRADFDTGHDFSPWIRRVNELLQQHSTFSNCGNIRFVDDGHDAIIAMWRHNPFGEERFLILANLDIFHRQRLRIDLKQHDLPLRGCTLHDRLGTRHLSVIGQRLELSLKPCEAMVWEVEEPPKDRV